MFERFYTYPPEECGWNWILRNMKQKPLPCKHEIVDVKIMDLKTPPHQYSEEKLQEWTKLKTDGWKVVPDCFDLKGEFGIDCGFDTIEYSKELLTELYNGEETLMPVLQCKNDDYTILKEYIQWFKSHHDTPALIGVSGSICRNKNYNFVSSCLKLVKREFPNTWIHAFALRFTNFIYFKHLINSFDSSNWTFPRTPNRGSCKNKAERIEFFYDYINRINEIMTPYNREQMRLGMV